MNHNLSTYTKNNITFFARAGTSDKKAIDEVMSGGYRRTRPFSFDVLPGETWIDFGAMIGAFSAYAISKGAVRVIAVEPDPEHVAILQMNAPKAEVIAGAVVLDDRKTVTLNKNDKRGNTWRNSILKKWQGGSTVEVQAFNFLSILQTAGSNICLKIDIEGMEMPILEYLIENPHLFEYINKLVFEWSFDVDSSLNRFRAVMSKLKQVFPHVSPDKMYLEHSEWQKSWFPACTTIFCSK